MIDEFMLYEDLRIGPNFFISNRAKFFSVIFGDDPGIVYEEMASLYLFLVTHFLIDFVFIPCLML
ncbi:hypothetical protein HanLR1_Chr04g0154921 [Helianthus annuus]|nr:hypothetical protein HanHA89_Chr04g0163321 [Helianthus annuus]KAJ0758849.1 hypothetical protein HanLR1_Chr04g0154921 [Helianthus annuus]